MALCLRLINALTCRFTGAPIVPGPTGDGLLLAGTTDMYLKRAGNVGFVLLAGT